MGWTINNRTTESLGVTVANWSESASSIDELHLTVAAQDYAGVIPADLAQGKTVSLHLNGAQKFKGRVIRTPSSATAEGEGMEYVIAGVWWYLDNLIFARKRKYFTGMSDPVEGEDPQPQFAEKHLSYAVMGRDGEKTGARITEVLQYAMSQGAPISFGTIDTGIEWWPCEHRDQTCGEIIRQYLDIMSNCVAYIDYSSALPSFNIKNEAFLTPKTLNISEGNLISSHSITTLASEKPSGIVIRYEITSQSAGQTYIEIFEDTAGATSGFGVLHLTVPLNGENITLEKAVVGTQRIPKDGDTNGYAIRWWVNRIPGLTPLIKKKGLNAVLGMVKLSSSNDDTEGILRHVITFPEKPADPIPINPESEPLTHTENPHDYPNELVSGAIPDWMLRTEDAHIEDRTILIRARRVKATVTLGISAATVDAMPDDEKKITIAAFPKKKPLNGVESYINTYNAEFVGTNAQNKEYSKVASYEFPEKPKLGVAAAFLSQYNRTKYSGSVTIIEEEISKQLKLGQKINFGGGDPAWATANEPIKKVTYDAETGETVAEFGPTDVLGPQDMIDRAHISLRAPLNYGFDSSKKDVPHTSGISHTPVSSVTPASSQATNETHPWQVTLSKKSGVWTATIVGGRVFNHELAAAYTKVEMSDPKNPKKIENVVDKDIVCLKYTYDPELYEIIKVAEEDFKVLHTGDISGFNIVTHKPLAKIVANKIHSQKLEVEQYSRRDFSKSLFNYNGNVAYSFNPY